MHIAIGARANASCKCIVVGLMNFQDSIISMNSVPIAIILFGLLLFSSLEFQAQRLILGIKFECCLEARRLPCEFFSLQ